MQENKGRPQGTVQKKEEADPAERKAEMGSEFSCMRHMWASERRQNKELNG